MIFAHKIKMIFAPPVQVVLMAMAMWCAQLTCFDVGATMDDSAAFIFALAFGKSKKKYNLRGRANFALHPDNTNRRRMQVSPVAPFRRKTAVAKIATRKAGHLLSGPAR